MSDANLASLAVRRSGTSQFKSVRYTGEDLKFNKETAQSQEIRDDRQIPDLAKVGGQPEGGFSFELSFLAQQWLIAAALHASWIDINITTNATLTASTQVVAGSAGDFDDVPVGCLVKIAGAATSGNNGLKRVVAKAANGSTITLASGSIVADGGSASLTFTGRTISNGKEVIKNDFEKCIVNSAGANYFLRYMGMKNDSMELNIESKKIVTGSSKFVGETYDVGDAGEDPGAVEGVKASGVLTFTGQPTATHTVTIGGVVYTFVASADEAGEVTIGATLDDTIANLADEINGEGFTDIHELVSAVAAATTLTVTALEMGTEGNAIATTETSTAASWANATLTGGVDQTTGYTDTDAGDVLNGTSNMGTIQMDGATAQDRFKSIKLMIGNNVRGKDALSVDGNWDVGLGTIGVTGNLNAYFRDNTLPLKIKQHTSFSLAFYLEDSAGNQLHCYMPTVKPANGDPTISGINTDVMIETNFQAILDPVLRKTIIFDAIAA